MFGKKKPVPRWILQLFQEGDKYWYAWLPLNEEGKLSPMNTVVFDYYVAYFERMEHTMAWHFRGGCTLQEKLSEEELRKDFLEQGGKLVGELPKPPDDYVDMFFPEDKEMNEI